MVFNRFFFLIVIRVLLILSNSVIIGAIFGRGDLLFTQIGLFTLLIIQAGELTSFVSRTNKIVTRFVDAILYEDYSTKFGRNRHSSSFHKLNEALGKVLQLLSEKDSIHQGQLLFLEKLIDQIDFAIICFDFKGDLAFINDKASTLLDVPKIQKWRNLQSPGASLLGDIQGIGNAKNKIIESRIASTTKIFNINSSEITIRGTKYQIVSFHDIRAAIQTKEVESTQKMIRILTHEIMNSVTPFVSLADTMKVIIERTELPKEQKDDLLEAAATINERSSGILDFVSNYRKLTRINTPGFEFFQLKAVLDRVCRLYEEQAARHNIAVAINAEDIQMKGDPHLLEQSFINLHKNAIDAIATTRSDQGNLTWDLNMEKEYLVISLLDSGCGIPTEELNKVFLPFYSTKQEGSGIGLALTRLVMELHKGHIEVESDMDAGTKISLFFPAHLSG